MLDLQAKQCYRLLLRVWVSHVVRARWTCHHSQCKSWFGELLGPGVKGHSQEAWQSILLWRLLSGIELLKIE